MKKTKKAAMIFGIAAGLSMLASTASFAGEWKKDDTGWWYQYDATNYAVNTWIGNYYVGDRGYMLESQLTPDGYMVNDDGSWYVAKPENAAEAYQKYRLYRYAGIFDYACPYVVFLEKDFNNDGVLDMLTVTINSFDAMDQDHPVPAKIELLTINNGKVEVRDHIDTYSEHEIDTRLMQYLGDDIVVQFYGDMVNEVYKINSSLHFESIPITDHESEWTDLVYENRIYRLYKLDFKWVDCQLMTGRCTGQEECRLDDYFGDDYYL